MIYIYVNKLMSALRDLSDRDFQNRVWLHVEGPEISFFDEAVCQAFDDTGLSVSLNKGRCPPELDANSFAALKELHDTTSRVPESLDVATLLDSPQMEEVREKARTALCLLEQRHPASPPPPPPEREEVVARLEALASGDVSREEVSDWAARWVRMETSNINDQLIWEAVGTLSSADAKSAGGKYLYNEEDFQRWLNTVRRN